MFRKVWLIRNVPEDTISRIKKYAKTNKLRVWQVIKMMAEKLD